MKKIVASVLLATFAASAFAACPPSAPYACRSTMGGKMACGCGF